MKLNIEELEYYDGKKIKIVCYDGFELQGKCSWSWDEDDEDDEDCFRFKVPYGIEEIPISDIAEIKLIEEDEAK